MFKVGDKIRGLRNEYTFTNKDWEGIVTAVTDDGGFTVKTTKWGTFGELDREFDLHIFGDFELISTVRKGNCNKFKDSNYV